LHFWRTFVEFPKEQSPSNSMERNAHGTAALYPSQVEEETESHNTDDDLPFAIQALSASFNEAITRSYDDSDNDKSKNYSKTNSDDIGSSDDGLSSGIQALSSSSESDDYLPSAIQALSMSLQESDMGRPHEALMAGLEDSSSTSLENQEALTTSQYSISEIVRSSSKEIESSDWHEEQVLKRALRGSTEIVFGNEDEAGHEIEGETPRDVEKEWDETKSDDLTFGIKALSMSLSAEEKLPGPCLDKTIVFAPGAIGLQLEPVREDPKYACRVIRFVDGGPRNPGQARMSGKIMPGDAIIRAEANGIVGTSYEVIMQILTDAWATRTLIFQSMWDSSVLDAPTEATLRPIEKTVPPSVGFQRNILSTKSRLKEDTIDKKIETLLSFQKQADQEPSSLHDNISVDAEETKFENALNLQSNETSGWRFWALGDAKPSSSQGPSMTLQDASTVEDVMMLPKWNESKVERPSTAQSNTIHGRRFWSIRGAEEGPSPALIFNESSPFRHMEQSSEPEPKANEDPLTVRHYRRQGWQFGALGTTNPSPRVEQSSPLQGTKVQVTAGEEKNKDLPKSMDEHGWLFWSRLDAHQSQRSPLLELSSHAQTQVSHHSHHPSCDKIAESYLSCDENEASISLAMQPNHGKEDSKNLISEKQTGRRKQSGPGTQSQADGGITHGQVRQVIEKGDFAGMVYLSSVKLDSATPSQHFHASLSETISSKTPLPCALSYDEQERQLESCENDSEVTIISMWHLGQIEESDFEGKVHVSSIRPDSEALHQHSHRLLPQAVSDKRLLCQLPYDQLQTQLNIVVKSQQAAETKLRAKEEINIQKENEAEAARSKAKEDARIAAAENARLEREEAERLARVAEEKARQSAEEEARQRAEKEARLRAEEHGRQVTEEEVRFQQDCRRRAEEESRNQKERESSWPAEQENVCQIQEQARMQQEKEDVQPKKTIVFTPGPVGLHLEAVLANPKYACRVVRFVDGGPKNPGQARKSGIMNPGDYVIRAEAEGIVGADSYDEIMRVLKHASVPRTLTIRSAWKSSLLDTKPKPKPSDPVKSVDRSPVSTLVESSLPEAKPESSLSVQTTDQSHAPPLVEPNNSPALPEKHENSPKNKSNAEYVPQEVTTIAEPSESRKMMLPSFETLRKNYVSIEKLRPIQQKHVVKIKEPETKIKPALPEDWVNNGAPLEKKALSKEEKLAREKRYQEEASRLMFEAEARRRTIQAEEARKSWNFENVVLGAVALTANCTVGVVSLAASAVSVCLKTKRHFDDEECSHSKKAK
jgi:hypothetical protein